MHEASPPLLAFGWASLAAAHAWSRLRHGGGGLPWVMNVLWLSTWAMVGSTIVVGLEEGLLGHEGELAGVNWLHLAQQGLTVSYLALLAVSAGWAFGWWRLDPARRVARAVGIRGRQTARALASLALMATGVVLSALAGLAVAALG